MKQIIDMGQDYFSNVELLQKTTCPLRELLTINTFIMHRIFEDGRLVTLSDQPEYSSEFLKIGGYKNSIYYRHPDVYKSGVVILPGAASKGQQEAFDTFSHNRGIKMSNSITFIEKHKNYVDLFLYLGDFTQEMLVKLSSLHNPLLKIFANHFRKEHQRLLDNLAEEAPNLALLLPDHFKKPISQVVLFSQLERYKTLTALEQVQLKLVLTGALATSHISRLKRKLGCKSLIELKKIARAIEDLDFDGHSTHYRNCSI